MLSVILEAHRDFASRVQTMIESKLSKPERVAKIIEDVYTSGASFDAWTDHFDYEKWLAAIEKAPLGLDFYVYRQRKIDEILPWDFIDIGVTKAFMKKEYQNALQEKVTPNCKEKCAGCGASVFKGGICFENKN
jgi:hypothetical protein